MCDSEPDVKDARQPLQPPKLPKGLADREAASSSAALDPLDPGRGMAERIRESPGYLTLTLETSSQSPQKVF